MSPDSTANSHWADSQDGQEKGLLKIHESQVLGHVVQGQTLDLHPVTCLHPGPHGAVAQRRAGKAHSLSHSGAHAAGAPKRELAASWERSEVK